jgi:anaerobic selenocysteine-containing dehydrogenase
MEEELNKKGFSRRNFIKGTAGVAALGVLGACAPQTVQETPAATEAVAATGSARVVMGYAAGGNCRTAILLKIDTSAGNRGWQIQVGFGLLGF